MQPAPRLHELLPEALGGNLHGVEMEITPAYLAMGQGSLSRRPISAAGLPAHRSLAWQQGLLSSVSQAACLSIDQAYMHSHASGFACSIMAAIPEAQPAAADVPEGIPSLEERMQAVHPRFDRVCKLLRIDGRRYKRVHQCPWLFLAAEALWLLSAGPVLTVYGFGTGWALDYAIAAVCYCVTVYIKPAYCSFCDEPSDLARAPLIIWAVGGVIGVPTSIYLTVRSALADAHHVPFQDPFRYTLASGVWVRPMLADVSSGAKKSCSDGYSSHLIAPCCHRAARSLAPAY